MKTVGLLTLIAAVGILGMSIFLVSNSQQNVSLNIKASTNLTVNGMVVSDNPSECATSFYLGCYQLKDENGVSYDLVEDGGNLNFAPYVGRKVRIVGKLADIKNKNVLMVSSITFN